MVEVCLVDLETEEVAGMALTVCSVVWSLVEALAWVQHRVDFLVLTDDIQWEVLVCQSASRNQ